MNSDRTPASGVAINYYQPTGQKETITSREDGSMPGAVCPACKTENIQAVQAMLVRPVALAGVTPKLGGEMGVQLICSNPACTLPPSPVVTPRRPRSYEPARDLDAWRVR